MSLRDRISEDMKAAMRARDVERLGTIRLLQAALKQREVDERITLQDGDVLAAIEKMIKQRRDSIQQFAAGARPDLVAKEEAEVAVLMSYMPAPLSDAELDRILVGVIASTGAQGAKDMGKVMNALRPLVAGRADMGKLSAIVKARLV